MLHRITNFFRQLYNSKGFQCGLCIFIGVFVIYYLYNVIIYLSAVMNTGVSLGEALRFYFELPFFYTGFLPPSAGVALGIAIGLVWYFSMKRKSRKILNLMIWQKNPQTLYRKKRSLKRHTAGINKLQRDLLIFFTFTFETTE